MLAVLMMAGSTNVPFLSCVTKPLRGTTSASRTSTFKIAGSDTLNSQSQEGIADSRTLTPVCPD